VNSRDLDLDALIEWAATERPETDEAVRALVAEVRALREECRGWRDVALDRADP
jgi:hypothetical protein